MVDEAVKILNDDPYAPNLTRTKYLIDAIMLKTREVLRKQKIG